jgi:putative N6-adenine-specific DNA methylase
LSSTSDKPPRKTIRLNKDVAAEGSTPPGEKAKRRPVRWSSLARDRSAPVREEKTAAPTPAEKEPRRSDQPAAGADARGKGPATGRREQREGYPQDRPRRKSPPAAQAGGPERAEPNRPRTPRPRPRAARLQFFAPCPRGLEAELAKELEALGAQDCVPGSGGVAFPGDMQLAWKANLWSRLAIRVLQQVGTGSYASEDDLYQAALRLPWPEWFAHERTIAVRTVAHASPLKSLNFASLKIKDAVCDRFRQDGLPRPDVDAREPQVPILLYLERDRYSLYLDLTGTPLNRRGYRVDPAPAPLNENLAAGLLKLSGWTPDIPLLDPMMGGGTILLEAALMALNIAPGLKRHFAFEHLASFDKVEWARLRKDAQAAALDRRQLAIYGCDIDPRMVRAAHNNLRAAGLDDCVLIDEGDVLTVQAPEAGGVIVSNPPYGVRLTVGQGASAPQPARGEAQPEDFIAFYQALGDALKQRFSGWTAFLLSADPDLARHIGLKSGRRTPLYNGPLECRLFEYRLVAGSLRKDEGRADPA